MIAVVFESFVRAGSQRHLVEILKGIRLFVPDLPCTLFLIGPLSHSWSSFLPEVEQAGIPVVQLPYVFRRVEGNSLLARALNRWNCLALEPKLNSSFFEQLANFDSVICAQPFVADLLLPHLQPQQRFCFHLMEHLAQRPSSTYDRLLQHRRLELIYMHSSQVAQLPPRIARRPTLTWPVRLCPDHLLAPLPSSPAADGLLRLAHYSRISPMRLIDQVIDAFALLQQRTPASLRIAGFIEDKAYHQNLLSQIGIPEKSDQPGGLI
jgi:glycosyltransferase involved in cell wall biosynthesis